MRVQHRQKIVDVVALSAYIDANELTIKTAFLTLLSNDIFYMVDSERPLRRGYADLTMILRPEMRQYQLLDLLLEFKFVKLSEIGLRGREVREKTKAELAALDPVETKLSQARQQGQDYRASLQTTYGNRLKLRTFAVVAIGFETLLWQEVK